jgi:hypothetical protein
MNKVIPLVFALSIFSGSTAHGMPVLRFGQPQATRPRMRPRCLSRSLLQLDAGLRLRTQLRDEVSQLSQCSLPWTLRSLL